MSLLPTRRRRRRRRLRRSFSRLVCGLLVCRRRHRRHGSINNRARAVDGPQPGLSRRYRRRQSCLDARPRAFSRRPSAVAFVTRSPVQVYFLRGRIGPRAQSRGTVLRPRLSATTLAERMAAESSTPPAAAVISEVSNDQPSDGALPKDNVFEPHHNTCKVLLPVNVLQPPADSAKRVLLPPNKTCRLLVLPSPSSYRRKR